MFQNSTTCSTEVEQKLQIRKYLSKDYDSVRKIFSTEMPEAFVPALKANWNGDHPETVKCHLAILMACGLATQLISLEFGILTLGIIATVYFKVVYDWYFGRIR